jgi:large repetitive protein
MDDLNPTPMPEQVPEPTPVPDSVPEPTANPVVEPVAAPAAEPIVETAPVTPAPAVAPTPAPQKLLTPEEKAAKKKEMIKRMKLMAAILFIVVLGGITAWGLLVGQEPLGLFTSIGLSQAAFNNFLMTVFNVFFGLLVVSVLISTLVVLVKGLMVKKEELEKKKMMSKKALKMGIGFFLAAILWLVGIFMLQPVLVSESVFDTYIKTTPEDIIGITAPVEIIFDASGIPVDTNTYQILSYSWTFGDGDSGTGVAVSHRYTEKGSTDGRYTVLLEVDYMDIKSGEQFDSEFSTEVVIANEQVAASFIASPEAGELPLDVTFDASASTDPDGEIIAYEWDLDGDGRFDDGEGEVVEYTYTQEGEFEVTLQVTDNNGEVDEATMVIEAGSVGGLRAVITSTVPQGQNYILDEDYSFSAEDSEIRDGNISKYYWDFGDGTEVDGKNVSHTYEDEGDYEIVLTVVDASGNEDTESLEITVIDEGSPPQAGIETDPVATGDTVTGTVPFTVEFNGAASADPDDDIVEYEWDFDQDGFADETGNLADYTFEEVGTFPVTLIVTDSIGNTDETIIEVEVTEQGVVARLDVDETNGEVPLTINFDASSSTYNEGNIVSYEYDFGDGNTHVGGSSVTYKYTSVGTFAVTVTVLGDDGETGTSELQIVVRPVSLTSCFTVNADSGRAPLFMTVDPSCSQGTIEDYHWDFGDGDVSFDRKPDTHIYDEAGTYTITLEVTSDEGIVDTFSKSITVK